MRPLVVYGWIGRRLEAPKHHHQTREICAVRTKVELARICGVKRASQIWNLSETGNTEEIHKAMSKPGMVFWCGIDESYCIPPRPWREDVKGSV